METALFSGHDISATPTYKEQAYQLIKDAILFNRFRVGAVYSQESICTELGISRTPVREALLELQKDGYVTFNRGKGVMVNPVDDATAHDILEARMYTEQINARLAGSRATNEDIERMGQTLQQLKANLSSRDGRLLYRLDHQFHRAVAAASHNRLLYNQSQNFLDHYLRFEIKSVYNNVIDGTIVYAEHEDIFEAIKAKSPEQAEQAMARHLDNSYRRTVSRFWKTQEK